MAKDTAMGSAFERAGLHARDVKLMQALAEFFNNGGMVTRAREVVEAAIARLSGGGRERIASEGQLCCAPTRQPELSREGHPGFVENIGRSGDAISRQPNESGGQPPGADKATDKVPPLSPQRSGVGHAQYAEKARVHVPRPASPANLAAAKAVRQAIAITVLDTWKIRDGRAIGKVRIGELPAISATNRMEASILDQIKEHVGGADHSATVSDVISAQMLQRFIQKAAEVADAA